MITYAHIDRSVALPNPANWITRGLLVWLLPALPGVIHSCIAGTPTPEHTFCGEVNDTRRKLLMRFPAAVTVLMLAGFAIFAISR